MNRSISYWQWLLADICLDSAEPLLPDLGFPGVKHAALQKCLDDLLFDSSLETQEVAEFEHSIEQTLSSRLGNDALAVMTWLKTFPFSDEHNISTLSYWDAHLTDILFYDPPPQPANTNKPLWESLTAAFKTQPPPSGHAWSGTFEQAASVIHQRKSVMAAIEKIRANPLSPHDLDIYMHFGWNDYGNSQGLSSLESGSQLLSIKSFWQLVSPHIDAKTIEQIAHARDIEAWQASCNPELYIEPAQRYGVTPEQMVEDLLPKPTTPPQLSTLLG